MKTRHEQECVVQQRGRNQKKKNKMNSEPEEYND